MLALLVEQASIAIHLDRYARIVKELAIKRQVAQRAMEEAGCISSGTPTRLPWLES